MMGIRCWSMLALFPLLAFAMQAASTDKKFDEPPGKFLSLAKSSVVQEDLDRLKTLRPEHPRLYLLPGREAALKAVIERDPLAKATFEKVRKDAEKLLTQPVSEYKLKGPRLLDVSRRVLGRVTGLALTYRLTGDKRFADRAIQEMMAVCAFQDWHPPHFLDTAEMTNAAAIGYDWLYNELTPEQRATVKQKILDYGLAPAIKVYESGGWWAKSPFNWNEVCNGGIDAGALAIADEEPRVAAYILKQSTESIPRALESFEPDGGWAEGPGYWGYATSYTAYYLLGLQTALGTDFGLSDRNGLEKTGWFPAYVTGPLNKDFNYADAHAGAAGGWQLFWFAERYKQPFFADYERQHIAKGGGPMHLVVWQPQASEKMAMPPLDVKFESVQVAFLRSAWDDPKGLWFAMKGGDNQAGHSHLDLGTFVLDGAGQRWAVDLGGDDYNIPAYFGKLRFTYYRTKTEGHNTLTIGGANQNEKAKSKIIAFRSTSERAAAVVDLSDAYKDQAAKVQRGAAMLERKRILLVDEIEPAPGKSASVEWGMQTNAQVECRGAEAILTQGEAHLKATILEPKGAAFAVREITLDPPQKFLENTRKLSATVKVEGAPMRLAVLFEPYEGASAPETKAPEGLALKDWIAWAGQK
ncbi:MAG: heparinase II/III family protein [Candidatus Sumerlaeota bacterium]|nr:heparinase II/III family protein [Candidatus Sumerlaeota bacterium]